MRRPLKPANRTDCNLSPACILDNFVQLWPEFSKYLQYSFILYNKKCDISQMGLSQNELRSLIAISGGTEGDQVTRERRSADRV
jgi:hypothetical protein